MMDVAGSQNDRIERAMYNTDPLCAMMDPAVLAAPTCSHLAIQGHLVPICWIAVPFKGSQCVCFPFCTDVCSLQKSMHDNGKECNMDVV